MLLQLDRCKHQANIIFIKFYLFAETGSCLDPQIGRINLPLAGGDAKSSSCLTGAGSSLSGATAVEAAAAVASFSRSTT